MSPPTQRALFLDRDGVINHDAGYTSTIEGFVFIDGIFELCRVAKSQGYQLVVVTNQAGIGRGYYSEEDFQVLTEWMRERFREQGAELLDVFHCPYHPVHGIGQYRCDSYDRKPNPGMFERAERIHAIDLNHSAMLGDKDSDMKAARKAGLATRIHYVPDTQSGAISREATHRCRTLLECLPLLDRAAKAGAAIFFQSEKFEGQI
jgi:D-glycero-D-manno-heptose 1,7-bisphosphate phosphatase